MSEKLDYRQLRLIMTIAAFFSFMLFAGSYFSESHTPVLSPASIFFLDCEHGDDANNGTSPSSAWRSLEQGSTSILHPGDTLLLRRDCVWDDEHLTITHSGTAEQNIRIGAYGDGDQPHINNSQNNTSNVRILGAYITIENIHVSAEPPELDAQCSNNPVGHIVGFSFATGAHHNTLRYSQADGFYAGVFVRPGSHHNRILDNLFNNNAMMSPLTPGGNDDAGAFAILLWGDDNEIAYNIISGSNACSYDYLTDGAAIEIFGGQRNSIHHNRVADSDAFTELGNTRSVDNTYFYNFFISDLSQSIFLVTRGPIKGTRANNNTVYLTGARAQGFVCHMGCEFDTLSMRNNIIQAPYKVGFSDGSIDTDFNLFWGGGSLQFTPGPHSRVADPGFVSVSEGNLTLRADSQAIDSGQILGYTVDLSGNFIPEGALPDIGTYEFVQVKESLANSSTGENTSVRFAVIGDYGTGNDNAAAVADLVKSWLPDFIITTGDNNYINFGE